MRETKKQKKGKVNLSALNTERFLSTDDKLIEANAAKSKDKTENVSEVQEEPVATPKEQKLTDKSIRDLEQKKKLIKIPLLYEEAIIEIQKNDENFDMIGIDVGAFILKAVKDSLKLRGF